MLGTKKSGRFRLFIAVLLAAALVSAACGGDDGGDTPNGGTDQTDSSTSGDDNGAASGNGELSGEVIIGGIQSLSGNYAALGASMSAGAQLAVSALEARYPNLDVRYEECDDRTEVNGAVACYERFIAEGVSFIVGPALSAATAAVDPLTIRDEIMGAVLGGGYGGDSLNDNEFLLASLPSTQSALAAVLAHAIENDLSKGFMVSASGVLGDDCRAFWEDERFSDLHDQIDYLGHVDVDPTTEDFGPTMARVPSDAEFTFICLSGGSGVKAAASYANAGIDAPMYGIHSQGEEVTAGAYTQAGVPDGAIFVPSWCMKAALEGLLDDSDPCAQSTAELQEAYDAADLSAPLDIMVGMTYDLTVMLAEACGATDCSGPAMSDYIYNGEGSTFPGVLGAYSFAPGRGRGLDETNFLMTTLDGGGWSVDSLLSVGS